MAKWADYGISACRYNSEHTHIDKVKVHSDNGENFGSAIEYSRLEVISSIKAGKTFVTILKNNESTWKKGQPVIIVKINSKEYIKTVENNKEVDNLENLPEF